MMKAIINQSKKNPILREYTTSLVQSLRNKDWFGEINTVFNWVRNNIRYVQDINDIETLQIPVATIRLGHGDCDDMVMLMCAMLETIGYRTRSVAIGFDPDNYDHVYLEVFIPDTGKWVAADPTEKNALGWFAPSPCCIMRMNNS